jgi:serine/threonine-protein kinase RsbW
MTANVYSKKIYLSSKPTSIHHLEEYLHEVFSDVKICSNKYAEILISLTEAVNNAIIHGNKSDESKKVIIDCYCTYEGLFFSVIDEGTGFDPASLPDPTSPEHIECCGGRGVFIIHSLADKVAYKNNGTTLEIFFTHNEQ